MMLLILLNEKEEEEGFRYLEKSFTNITPGVEVRSRRVGGATFQIPSPVRDERKHSIGNEMVDWFL